MTDDGMLSQEEIDALLNASSDDDEEESEDLELESSSEINESDYLTSIEKDTLGEIGNISFGSSATTLSTLLNQKVDITTPTVSVIRKSDLLTEFEFELVSVEVEYVEGFTGRNVFVIKASDAAIISDIMLGGDGTNPEEELTEIHLSAVQEAMNQMMGAAATSMSTVFNKKIDISPPIIGVGEEAKHASTQSINEEIFVQVLFQLKVGTLIDSSIMQIIPFPFANEMVAELIEPSAGLEDTEEMLEDNLLEDLESVIEETEEQSSTGEVNLPKDKQETSPIAEKEVNMQEPKNIGTKVDEHAPIEQANFSAFDPIELNQTEQQNLDMLLDIPLEVTVELGRTERSIRDILDLTAGSVVELDKLAGEPVDVFVNKKLIAKGEVVVIEENFGVRVTDIISQTDRIMNLK